MVTFLMVARWEVCREGWVKKVEGLRSTTWELQNSHGNVKNSIGDIVAKEYVCMTQGPGQWCRDCLRVWGSLGGG